MVASIGAVAAPSQGVSYYERDGYYAKDDPDHRDASAWAGKGADALGRSGPVDPDVFTAILEGQVPDGPRLGRPGKDGEIVHRPGRDLTLSAPKSVSLVALVGGDARVAEAHGRAVTRTLAWVEERAVETRMKDPDGGRMIRAGDLHAAAGAKPRADDDLGACGAQLLHRLQAGGDPLRLAPAPACRRFGAGPGADIAVGQRLEPLDHVSVVGKAGSEEMHQKRVRRVAGHHHRSRHGVRLHLAGDDEWRRCPPPDTRPPSRSRANSVSWRRGAHRWNPDDRRQAGNTCWHAAAGTDGLGIEFRRQTVRMLNSGLGSPANPLFSANRGLEILGCLSRC